MANNVLDGMLSLRAAARSGFFGAALADQAAELARWHNKVGRDEISPSPRLA
jgi:hypothetical protein